jgi:membrane protease YdiL (CAAX protease family)
LRDTTGKRDALIRLALFVPLYIALEYLLQITFFGVAGRVKNDFVADTLATTATLIAALAAGGVMITRVDHRSLGALGFAWTKQTPRELAVGIAAGGGAIAAGTVLMFAIGALTYASEAGTAAGWAATIVRDLVVLFIAAAAEETVFRGYGFQVLARAFGPVAATIGTAALFAWAHVGNPNVTLFAVVNIFLAGLLLGFAYLRTMSLWFATAVHAGWNWVMASLFDLPVSGLSMFKTPLYEPATHGAKWISGGTFGPEGGIAGSVGLIVGMCAIAWLVKLRTAPEMLELRPIALDGSARKRTEESNE